MPVLGDLTINGQPRKVVMFANRNGFFYTIDRVTGKVIVARPFVETTWAKEIDSTGRPMLLPGNTPDEDGNKTCPDLGGGTNFMSPSFDPTTRLFFVTARETCAMYYAFDQKFKPGEQYTGGGHQRPRDQELRRASRDRSGHRPDEVGVPLHVRVSLRRAETASGLVFAGDGDGNIMAFDSRTGKTCGTTSSDSRCDRRRARPTCSTADKTRPGRVGRLRRRRASSDGLRGLVTGCGAGRDGAGNRLHQTLQRCHRARARTIRFASSSSSDARPSVRGTSGDHRRTRVSYTESFPLFGYDLSQYNELFAEKLDLLLKLRDENPINWEGHLRPSLVDGDVTPRPDRQIPVWIAVGELPGIGSSCSQAGTSPVAGHHRR